MKRFNPFCVMVALFALIIAACSKDDNKADNKPENPKELILEKTSLTLKVAETATLTVTSGNGYYTVKVADQAVASATVTQNTLKITAIAQGETVVTVADAKGKTASLSVTVTGIFAVVDKSVTVENGAKTDVKLQNGHANYNCVCVPEGVVLVSAKTDNVLSVEGLKVGSATVTVTDVQSGKQDIFEVTVTGMPFTISKNSFVLEVGNTEQVAITSGNPDYKVQYSIENVVKAQINGNIIHLTAVGAGKANVIITDAAQQKATIAVTVNGAVAGDIFDVDEGEDENEGEKVVSLKMSAVATGAITIPDEGTVLAEEIFKNNRDIISADLKNIKKIGDGAFWGNANLKKVVMTKVKHIGFQAFISSGLTELTLPASIENIGQSAFQDNKALVKVTSLAVTPPTIQSQTFAGVWNNSTKTVVLYVPKGSKTAYTNHEHWKNFKEIRELN